MTSTLAALLLLLLLLSGQATDAQFAFSTHNLPGSSKAKSSSSSSSSSIDQQQEDAHQQQQQASVQMQQPQHQHEQNQQEDVQEQQHRAQIVNPHPVKQKKQRLTFEDVDAASKQHGKRHAGRQPSSGRHQKQQKQQPQQLPQQHKQQPQQPQQQQRVQPHPQQGGLPLETLHHPDHHQQQHNSITGMRFGSVSAGTEAQQQQGGGVSLGDTLSSGGAQLPTSSGAGIHPVGRGSSTGFGFPGFGILGNPAAARPQRDSSHTDSNGGSGSSVGHPGAAGGAGFPRFGGIGGAFGGGLPPPQQGTDQSIKQPPAAGGSSSGGGAGFPRFGGFGGGLMQGQPGSARPGPQTPGVSGSSSSDSDHGQPLPRAGGGGGGAGFPRFGGFGGGSAPAGTGRPKAGPAPAAGAAPDVGGSGDGGVEAVPPAAQKPAKGAPWRPGLGGGPAAAAQQQQQQNHQQQQQEAKAGLPHPGDGNGPPLNGAAKPRLPEPGYRQGAGGPHWMPPVGMSIGGGRPRPPGGPAFRPPFGPGFGAPSGPSFGPSFIPKRQQQQQQQQQRARAVDDMYMDPADYYDYEGAEVHSQHQGHLDDTEYDAEHFHPHPSPSPPQQPPNSSPGPTPATPAGEAAAPADPPAYEGADHVPLPSPPQPPPHPHKLAPEEGESHQQGSAQQQQQQQYADTDTDHFIQQSPYPDLDNDLAAAEQQQLQPPGYSPYPWDPHTEHFPPGYSPYPWEPHTEQLPPGYSPYPWHPHPAARAGLQDLLAAQHFQQQQQAPSSPQPWHEGDWPQQQQQQQQHDDGGDILAAEHFPQSSPQPWLEDAAAHDSDIQQQEQQQQQQQGQQHAPPASPQPGKQQQQQGAPSGTDSSSTPGTPQQQQQQAPNASPKRGEQQQDRFPWSAWEPLPGTAAPAQSNDTQQVVQDNRLFPEELEQSKQPRATQQQQAAQGARHFFGPSFMAYGFHRNASYDWYPGGTRPFSGFGMYDIPRGEGWDEYGSWAGHHGGGGYGGGYGGYGGYGYGDYGYGGDYYGGYGYGEGGYGYGGDYYGGYGDYYGGYGGDYNSSYGGYGGYGGYGHHGHGDYWDRWALGIGVNGGAKHGTWKGSIWDKIEEQKPGAYHCGVCCPGTNITVEENERLGLPITPRVPAVPGPAAVVSPESGALPPESTPSPSEGDIVVTASLELFTQGGATIQGPVRPAQSTVNGTVAAEVTVTAQCPRMPQPGEPGYTTICKHDNTSNLQIGGSCQLVCTNPVDYLTVTPIEIGWTGGCVECEDSKTTCHYIAVNPPVDADGIQSGTAAEPPYTFSCTVTAVAKCCKQLCKPKKHHPSKPPPKVSYGRDHGYSSYGYGGKHKGGKHGKYYSTPDGKVHFSEVRENRPPRPPRPPPSPPPPPATKPVQKRKAYMQGPDAMAQHRRTVRREA